MSYIKQQVLAVRPEAVPSLRPSTIQYIAQAAKKVDIGLKGKKDFLTIIPEAGQIISKVNRKVTICPL